MIYLNINLRNPWSDTCEPIKSWSGKTPLPNKFWQIEFLKNDNWFRFEFGFTIFQDHAGVNLELGLLHREIHFTVYDSRHWDYDNECWKTYHEEER